MKVEKCPHACSYRSGFTEIRMERRGMRHFPVSGEEDAIRIHRCGTGGDKCHHDCFCIDKPPLIKGALGGDADKVAPHQWNDKSVKDGSTEQTGCVKFLISGCSWRSQPRWEATAGDILTKIYNTPEKLTESRFFRGRKTLFPASEQERTHS